jgi:hypothetical protein
MVSNALDAHAAATPDVKADETASVPTTKYQHIHCEEEAPMARKKMDQTHIQSFISHVLWESLLSSIAIAFLSFIILRLIRAIRSLSVNVASLHQQMSSMQQRLELIDRAAPV